MALGRMWSTNTVRPQARLDSLEQLRSALGCTAWKLLSAARARAVDETARDLRALECSVMKCRLDFDPVVKSINHVLLIIDTEEPLLAPIVEGMMVALENLGGNRLEMGALVIGTQIVECLHVTY